MYGNKGDKYNASFRSASAAEKGYFTKSVKEVTQPISKGIHPTMNPNGVAFRESRDSTTNPHSFPYQFYLDVTGSMLDVPQILIRDGLPTLMSKLIQGVSPDATLMIGCIGDHECDRFPLQVGQFESGDKELDMWLERILIEGGGGSNPGESYPLAWYFAAFHTQTDAWEKRKDKGIVITCGDEPPLLNFPISAIKEIMGSTAQGQSTYTAQDLLKAARERNHVYHLHVNHGHRRGVSHLWKQLLGQDVIEVEGAEGVVPAILKIAAQHAPVYVTAGETSVTTEPFSTDISDDLNTIKSETPGDFFDNIVNDDDII